MRVLITGATGFIGSRLVRALRQHHDIVACARHPHRLQDRFPEIHAVPVDFTTLRSSRDWLPLLDDVDAVVNAVGIFRETGTQTFEQLHHRAPAALFEACAAAGVRKVIQISALGSDDNASSRYHLSKKAADDRLRQLDLDWVILKPSLVYGQGGASAEFFGAMAALPLVPVVGRGDQRVQPIELDDLVAAVGALLSPHAAARCSIDAVGPAPISVREMLSAYRSWLGMAPSRFVPVPFPLALAGGKLGGALGVAPLSADAIRMLQRGNTGDVRSLRETTGVSPRSLDAVLRDRPAGQPERWHARLFFLRPLLRIAIGLLWLVTGILSLGVYPTTQSYALLAEVGVTGALAPVALYGAALLDLGLGLATLTRFRIQLVGTLQIVLMVAYSMLISLGPSEYWLHPFGPVTKNIPLIVATLVMMAMERD